ncbi:hypothetical protein GCM10009569_22300 [Arthrobacter russicus]
MGHTTDCETAKTYTCVCPCGGARHGAILIRGIVTSDPAVQVEAKNWAAPLDSFAGEYPGDND